MQVIRGRGLCESSYRGRGLCESSYVGYALTTQWEGESHEKLQMIGFDMGGTSTDVSRYAGSYEHVFESTSAGDLATMFAQSHG